MKENNPDPTTVPAPLAFFVGSISQSGNSSAFTLTRAPHTIMSQALMRLCIYSNFTIHNTLISLLANWTWTQLCKHLARSSHYSAWVQDSDSFLFKTALIITIISKCAIIYLLKSAVPLPSGCIIFKWMKFRFFVCFRWELGWKSDQIMLDTRHKQLGLRISIEFPGTWGQFIWCNRSGENSASKSFIV